MDIATDAATARPVIVAFVNYFDATTFGRIVYLTADDERRLRNVLAALRDYGLPLEASFEPAAPGYGYADVAAHLRATTGAPIADAALAAAERSVPRSGPVPAAVMPVWPFEPQGGTRCSARRGCGASTYRSRRCASRTTTIRRRCRRCATGSAVGPKPWATAGC